MIEGRNNGFPRIQYAWFPFLLNRRIIYTEITPSYTVTATSPLGICKSC